jgi:hypothetical protein
MSRVRFATARDLFETFPMAGTLISSPPTDELPLDYLRSLVAKGKIDDAVTFCAYLLPRREAVWWACRSVRALLGNSQTHNADCVRAAEAWVQEPDQEHQEAAQDVGTRSDRNSPLTWLAFAAAWSGGVVSIEGSPRIVPPPQLTAHAVRVAILLSARQTMPPESDAGQQVMPPERSPRLRACIGDGISLAESGLS